MDTSSEILARQSFALIQIGDKDAFNTLFGKYYDRIYSTALQFCKLPATAEDVTQQVFLKVWEKKESLSGIENPEAWLFTIARNQVMDVLRKQLVEEKYCRYILEIFREEEDTPEQLLIHRQKAAVIEKSLSGLSPKQQEVYRLHRQQGLTYNEIAKRLGISRDTVKEHIAKAVCRIRRFLSEHKDELIGMLIVLLVGFIF